MKPKTFLQENRLISAIKAFTTRGGFLIALVSAFGLWLGLTIEEVPFVLFVKAYSGMPSFTKSANPGLYWLSMAVCFAVVILYLVGWVVRLIESKRPPVSRKSETGSPPNA